MIQIDHMEEEKINIWTFIGHLWGAYRHLRAYMHCAVAISYSFCYLLMIPITQTLQQLLYHPRVIHPIQHHQIIMYNLSILFLLSSSLIFHVICKDSSPSYTCINKGHLVYNVWVLGYILPPVNHSPKSWNQLHCSLQDIRYTAISY